LKHVLALLVVNRPAVLSHISGLISRRAYNIDSIAAGPTEDPKVTRITLVVECEPDEIQQAQWVKNERSRILEEAKAEYESLLNEAMKKAEALVETDEITVKAKARAEEIIRVASEHSSIMKMSILDYTDSMLYNLQEKMDQMYALYFTDMYNDLQMTFDKVNENIATSRNEVKDQIYKAQVEKNE